ncbi:MAG: DNA polymerase IV 1 [Chlamydiae bacterium]|nr:DNA polymerase IV 1 [Chlamydiota bacterium]
MSSIGLVDCNNFYVSCERLFNPKLIGKPVVVLSNNEGCIVARSQEARALGIPVGAPAFQWREVIEKQRVIVCSSNFALYGDLSHRVMEILASFNPELEIYSIDEAFLSLDEVKDPIKECRSLRQKVLQWTGIPVSIGIAPTKTLAKVANHMAKSDLKRRGVCRIDQVRDDLPVEEIWGIGRRLADFLKKRGIFTAGELVGQEDLWIRKNLSVTGLRTVWELRGIPCFTIDDAPTAKQSIMTSRSWRDPLHTKTEITEAIIGHVVRGAEKLRKEESRASWLQVFIMTSPHQNNYYGNRVQIVFPQPTDYTPTLIRYAKQALEEIFRPGYAYKKGGVLLGELVDVNGFQPDLFAEQNMEKEETVMKLVDATNRKFGYSILQFAAEGCHSPEKRRQMLRSPCYTTRWDELLTIKI